MISARRPIKGHGLISGVLVVGLIISCIAMQAAFSSGDRQLAQLFAIFSVALCISSTLSIYLHAVRYVERRKLERAQAHVRVLNSDRDYRATYSLKDRITFSILTVGSALFAYFALVHHGQLWVTILISAMFLFCAVTLYRYLFTSVWFTDKLVVVEVKLITRYSEPYRSVTAMRAQPGNLRIEFSDRRTLNLPSGLGDLARITAILENHVESLPDFGKSEGKHAKP